MFSVIHAQSQVEIKSHYWPFSGLCTSYILDVMPKKDFNKHLLGFSQRGWPLPRPEMCFEMFFVKLNKKSFDFQNKLKNVAYYTLFLKIHNAR